MNDPRFQTALLLQNILENKVFASEAKSHLVLSKEADAAFVNMLLQTSLRHLIHIKKIIKTFVKKKLPSKSNLAIYLLILGTTEILYMDTPDYAVINSYVEITKKKFDKYIAGFVNAVLRKICSSKETFTENNTFFPSEFRRIINSSYSKKQSLAIEDSFINEPLLDITCKPDFNFDDGILLPLGSYRLKNNGNISKIFGFSQGLWWVQDFSSSLPVKLLPDIKNKQVLDVCAAPGGKTAQLITKGAKVTALDISPTRLKRLQENLKRLNLQAQDIICADALEWLKEHNQESFDVVLLDAPCSATGTLRRHPELVHIKTIKDVATMTKVQYQLLNLASQALKPHGILVYCTCSLSKAEGEEQIQNFLSEHKNFKTYIPELPQDLSSLKTPQGWIRILPNHLSEFGGADGFFIAILTKE